MSRSGTETRRSVPSGFASRCDSLGTSNPRPGMINLGTPSFSDNQANTHCPRGPVLVGGSRGQCPPDCQEGARRVVEGFNEDPAPRIVGCFDSTKRYPVDRLVLTSPVKC